MANARKMARTGISSSSKNEPREVWSGHYATISKMVIKKLEDGTIIAQDGSGIYLTSSIWLDKKMADPNRSGNVRFTSIESAEMAAAQKKVSTNEK